MKFAVSTILIAVLSALATWVMPWWMIAVVAFVVSFTFQLSAGKAFLSGFLGIAIFWFVAIVSINSANEHILSTRMAKLFGMPNYWLFIILNAIIGGLVGGFAAWTGAILRNTFMRPQS